MIIVKVLVAAALTAKSSQNLLVSRPTGLPVLDELGENHGLPMLAFLFGQIELWMCLLFSRMIMFNDG